MTGERHAYVSYYHTAGCRIARSAPLACDNPVQLKNCAQCHLDAAIDTPCNGVLMRASAPAAERLRYQPLTQAVKIQLGG